MKPKRRAKLFKFFGIKKLPYLPFILGIETGNICNLKCPLCPTGQDDPSMKKGFMSLELFKRIIGAFKNSVTSLNLYSWGEPLLNPEFISIVRYAKEIKPSLRIVTSTNLNIRNDLLLGELINSGIDEIIISCDGATEGAYIKYRRGGDFNLVLKNMELLVSLKNRLNSKVDLVWNFLVFKHNQDQVEQAKELAKQIGVSFRLGKMRTSMKDEILRPHAESIKKYREWIPDNPEYSAYDLERCAARKIVKTCRKPWQEISFNWDGKVFPCCAVYGDQYSFGDIKNTDIIQAWNSKAYLQARAQILNKKNKATTICGICRDNSFMHM